MLMFALALAVAAPCPGTTTIEVDACLKSQLDKADAALNRYYKAAIARLREEKEDAATQKLIQGQRAWVTYRDAECGAVYDYWSQGTIRGSMGLDCSIRVTTLRTYSIWRDWLTYMDSTPPLLPRPKVEAVTAEGRGS